MDRDQDVLNKVKEMVSCCLNDDLVEIKDHSTFTLGIKTNSGDFKENLEKIKALHNSLGYLVGALETVGRDCNDSMPSSDDANDEGLVRWKVDGIWIPGPVTDVRPEGATRWKPIPDRSDAFD